MSGTHSSQISSAASESGARAAAAPLALVPIRVTLLGAAEVGKTSLASAFANNFFPMKYVPTTDPTLFYKTLELADVSGGQPFTVLAEIEDTFPWSMDAGKDRYGRRRDASLFVRPQGATAKAAKALTIARRDMSTGNTALMTGFPATGLPKYAPMAHRRMAYLVVFDPCDRNSWLQAQEVLDGLRSAAQDLPPPPVVCVVACKADRALDSNAVGILREAEGVASRGGWSFERLAASDMTKVGRLFHSVIAAVHDSEPLWQEQFSDNHMGRAGRYITAMLGGAGTA